MLMMIGSLA